MEYSLSMVFTTSGGKNATFTINGVKADLTKDQVSALMGDIIDQNIFTTSSGDLIAKSSAQFISKTVKKFDYE